MSSDDEESLVERGVALIGGGAMVGMVNHLICDLLDQEWYPITSIPYWLYALVWVACVAVLLVVSADRRAAQKAAREAEQRSLQEWRLRRAAAEEDDLEEDFEDEADESDEAIEAPEAVEAKVIENRQADVVDEEPPQVAAPASQPARPSGLPDWDASRLQAGPPTSSKWETPTILGVVGLALTVAQILLDLLQKT